MSAVTKDEREALQKRIQDFNETWGPLMGGGNNNRADFRFDMGGVALWISATACLVMLFSVAIGGAIGAFWISREFDRVDKELNERKEEGQRMQSYLSAIYVQAPQLQPKEEKQDADR